MESRAPAVVAVVVTTGSGPGLEATLASLEAQDYAELSLFVVANGDSEHVAARVAQVAPRAFVRILEENRGFAAACNEATLLVEGSAFYLFCHDDVRLESDAVQQMVEAAFRTNAGIVTPKVVAYEDPLILLHVGQTCDRFGVIQERIQPGEIDHGQQDLERDVFVAPGGVTLIRSDLFATLHGFDPLIAALGEDLDICWRAQLAGARIIVAPSAKVAHRESLARGERTINAVGTRGVSRQALQRRHQLLVVSTGWGRRSAPATMAVLLVMETMELIVALIGRDRDRGRAIVGSWRWLLTNRRRIRLRRRECHRTRVLTDADLRRLQMGGASRLKRFAVTLVRHGLDRARGILPPPDVVDEGVDAGVGFAAAFAEIEEFDEIPESRELEHRRRPTRYVTTFRSQASVIAVVALLWLIGSRNLIVMHLPIIGRLAPLDSWWSTWRHFFGSWSSVGVGSTSPGMPGYGVLGFAGTFVLGRMGILPRLALIGAVPLGAVGIARLLQDRVSNRARVAATVAYLGLPLGLNMISQGRIDVLVVVAGLPFVVRRLFELLAVPGFRTLPYPPAVPFGRRGWRASHAGQRMVATVLVALMSSMAPATLVVVVLVVTGVVLARLVERDENVGSTRPWRLIATMGLGVALLLLPLTIDTATAGSRVFGLFGLSRGPWSAPSFADILRGVDGSFGRSWLGWLLPGAALLGLTLCRGERRTIATKAATIATLTIVVTTLDARHWLGSFAPNLDVLLALYMVMLALLIGLGISAVELDLRQGGFGWRQITAAAMVTTLLVGAVPFLTNFGSGRFDLPTTSVAESMSALAPPSAAGYRVLWLGDPSVVPLAGWSVAPGLEVATSTNGLPGGDTLFSPPGAATSSVLIGAVQLALEGRTVRLGALLAEAGVATIVVMNTSSPELAGVQSAPVRAVPTSLISALGRQTDLSLELQTPSVEIFSNSLFRGLVAATSSTSVTGSTPVLGDGFSPGTLMPGATVTAAFAPPGAFALMINGRAVARTTSYGWAPTYRVGLHHEAVGHSLTGQLELQRLPFNGLVALVVLMLWLTVAFGCAGLPAGPLWFFHRRRQRVLSARHAKVDRDVE